MTLMAVRAHFNESFAIAKESGGQIVLAHAHVIQGEPDIMEFVDPEIN